MGLLWAGPQSAFLASEKSEATMEKKDKPIVSMSPEKRENVWNDLLIKEEGIIFGFDSVLKKGKVRSKRHPCVGTVGF